MVQEARRRSARTPPPTTRGCRAHSGTSAIGADRPRLYAARLAAPARGRGSPTSAARQRAPARAASPSSRSVPGRRVVSEHRAGRTPPAPAAGIASPPPARASAPPRGSSELARVRAATAARSIRRSDAAHARRRRRATATASIADVHPPTSRSHGHRPRPASRGPGPSAARRATGRERTSAQSVARLCEHVFVRWQSQTVEQDAQTRLPGYREAVVRRFDAPEALDTRFHEVHTKSALNSVPGGSRLPFCWTVNPYRGCSHACHSASRGRRTSTWTSTRGEDFEREIVVKVNVPEVLRAELARPSWKGERGAGHEHGPVSVGRGALQADARDLGGAARRAQPVLDPDEVAAAAARPGPAAGDRARSRR